MKTNIATLMNLISEGEKIINSYMYNIRSYAVNTTVEELDGRVTIIEDYKEDFESAMDVIYTQYKEVSRLKGILYERNNSFKLSDGRSIQEAIADNTMLRKIKSTYEQLLLSKNSKRRITEVNNSYFECKSVNFDSKDLKFKIKELDEKIQRTDFEISKLNSIEFEI